MKIKAPGKVRQQIKQTKDLKEIITTMKNISVVNIAHFEKRVRAVRQYAETIEKGFQIFLHGDSSGLLKRMEEEKKRKPYSIGAILIGSEKGFCGEFNEHLLSFFHDTVSKQEELKLIVIGPKIASRFEPDQIQTYEFPSSHEAISELLRDLLLAMEQWIEQRQVDKIVFFHHQLQSGLNYKPQVISIFPLNVDWLKKLKEKPWPTRCLPTFSMGRSELFYGLVQEWLYISMYRVFIESLASENAARLSSMQAAKKNIEDKLFDLESSYQQKRQEQITNELFDILSAFEALKIHKKK